SASPQPASRPGRHRRRRATGAPAPRDHGSWLSRSRQLQLLILTVKLNSDEKPSYFGAGLSSLSNDETGLPHKQAGQCPCSVRSLSPPLSPCCFPAPPWPAKSLTRWASPTCPTSRSASWY